MTCAWEWKSDWVKSGCKQKNVTFSIAIFFYFYWSVALLDAEGSQGSSWGGGRTREDTRHLTRCRRVGHNTCTFAHLASKSLFGSRIVNTISSVAFKMLIWLKLYRLQGYIRQVHFFPQLTKPKVSSCLCIHRILWKVCTTTQWVWFLMSCLDRYLPVSFWS